MDENILRDDFMDELLADDDFLVEALKPHASDLTPMLSPGDSHRSGSQSPQMARCLAEIDVLQKKIQKRKRKLERDLSNRDVIMDNDTERVRNRDRNRRELHSKSRSPYRNRRRSRSPDRDRTRQHNRKSRSRSPRNQHRTRRSNTPSRNNRSSSNHKSLSFLEELAQKFAERGQEFPEKDLIMQPQEMNQMPSMHPPTNMVYYPGHNPYATMPVIPQPDFPMNPMNPNSYYGINPMAIHPIQFPSTMPQQPQNINNLHEVSINEFMTKKNKKKALFQLNTIVGRRMVLVA